MALSCAVTLNVFVFIVLVTVLPPSGGQREPSLPVNKNSFTQIIRSSKSVPEGRSANFRDIIIRFYDNNDTAPYSYRLPELSRILDNPSFDPQRPTVLYAHGYVELHTDSSVRTVVRAYLRRGGRNVLLVDWANLAFGNYLVVSVDVAFIGKETGRAVVRLLRQGVPVEGLHLVGHSLGAHVMAYVARSLASKGFRLPRLTGLDPAYPGFYPPLLGQPLSKNDALFVDVIHTDGGGYGAPARCGHADFWPNGGHAKQPGCPSATIPFTDEDFCSHWRSWAFWAESVRGGQFLARPCGGHDTFLRGRCREAPPVPMGLQAKPGLRGNFYLRTAATEPYALGAIGTT